MQLSVVVPVFNESAVLPSFLQQLLPVLDQCSPDYEILFVNDGSTDGTLPLLTEWARNNPAIKVISLSRNFGKEAACSAGLSASRGDAVALIDADLQDPPQLLLTFWEKFKAGYDNIYGVRQDRSAD